LLSTARVSTAKVMKLGAKVQSMMVVARQFVLAPALIFR